MYLLDTIFKDMRTVTKSVVIKYEKEAKKTETIDTIRESDRYMSAVTKQDTFHTYTIFETDAIVNSGITDPVLVPMYVKDKYLIPNDRRQRIVEEQRKLIITNYQENNNYYRMLIGLPDTTDFNFIYLDEATAISLSLNPLIPIHEYNKDDLIMLEKKGIIDTLIKANPDKKYLNYMGSRKVDLVRARTSKNFAILYVDQNITESFYEEFNNLYEQCREYFMTAIYIKDYQNRYDLYDNFIAMMIMVMTIQRVIVNTFKYGIERDFYDIGSIQMMFNSYNVPFIENLPMEYQRILVRNLNNLLRYKSTDKVLYDICSLLGFERIKIFKYFLIREHNLDENENPIFVYKEEIQEDGTTKIVDDVEAMYNLYFQTVELKERNTALALSNSLNRLDYTQVVVDDPYWWDDDDDLKKVLYESEYNYVETKYLNMNIMYKLTEMLFEVVFVFRMLTDKKDEIQTINLELPKLFDKKEIPLFHIVVFLCALISRKNKMVGNIISSPTKVLSVMGFNFKADFATIKSEIQNNPKLYDQKMLTFLSDLRIDSVEEINGIFNNITALHDHIVEVLGNTQNKKVYHAYKKLHTALMVTEDSETVFTMSNGEVATTFVEYLEDVDPALSDFVQTAEDDKITEHVEHILYRLNLSITDLKHLYILNDSNNVLLNAAITLIRFFKSYTTDLSSFNILYLMNSRYWNMIKLVEDIDLMQKTIGVNDGGLVLLYGSNLQSVSKLTEKERLKMLFSVKGTSKTNVLKDKRVIRDTIKLIREP